MTDIQGYCPMGCGETLIVEFGGRVACSFDGCPYPMAVSDLLSDNETGHIVRVHDALTFDVQHPLRERLDGDMFRCEVYNRISKYAEPPPPGHYRVDEDGTWTPIPIRACCGKPHLGLVCPDGLVMCCLCFERVPTNDLAEDEDGDLTDVCKTCSNKEKAR